MEVQYSSGYSVRSLQVVHESKIQGPVLALRFDKDWICTARNYGRPEGTWPAQDSGLVVNELEGRNHSTLKYQNDWKRKRHDLRASDRRPIDAHEALTSILLHRLEPALGSKAGSS